MTDILKFSVDNLTLEKTRQITTDPIFMDTIFASDYRFQREGVHKDVTSKLLTVSHRDFPLRRVDGCEIPEAEARAITQRTFIPRQIGYQEKFCADDFKATVLALLTRQNLRQSDLTGTLFGALIAQMTMLENKKHLEPMAWFADETSANPQFNQINGYWKLIQEAVTANLAAHVSTYSGVALSSGQGIQILKDVIRNAAKELRGMMKMDKVIYIGTEVKNQLLDDIELGLSGSGLYATEIVDGREITRFDGIEVRVKEEWDDLASTVMGYGANPSNLVCYTAKQNMVWAINDTTDLSFEAFYSRDDMRYIMRNLFVFGVQIDYPTLLSVAY